jgi:VWFA-related protein
MWLNRHNYVRLYLILAALCAQEAAIRVDVQQVLVPVVVTDKKGHYVSGLRAADFQIFEDGVRQEIASFTSGAARHTFVICIDTLHASAAGAARIKAALENLFEKEKPGDAQYVLIGVGRQLQVLQPATSNPAAVLVKIRSAAFQNAMAGMDAAALSAELQQIRSRMGEFCRQCSCGAKSSCDSQIDALKQSIDAEAERWAAPTKVLLDQFKSVVEELAKLPTGRTLILISGGFEIDAKRAFYDAVSAYLPNRPQFKLENSTAGLRDALQVASDRNVVIFTIDSRGAAQASLESTSAMDAAHSAGSGGGDPIGMGGRSRQAPAANRTAVGTQTNPFAGTASASMEELARSTGGVYSHDNGALLKQLRGALADGRQYYLLSYVPKNSAHDGKYRAITVETGDKKLNLRAKAGYWAVAAQ